MPATALVPTMERRKTQDSAEAEVSYPEGALGTCTAPRGWQLARVAAGHDATI